ncbi:MAG TPA: galactonate dehydratase, partial [Blastocatellia bacterium]|nr:galactonate dehydratase [Blastocatellia bacterium]
MSNKEPIKDGSTNQETKNAKEGIERRTVLKSTAALAGLSAMNLMAKANTSAEPEAPYSPLAPEPTPVFQQRPTAKESVKITKLETFLVKPRWLFLKVHTNAGVYGLGEPIVEGRALTCATAIKEIEPYLVGKDPRAVVHHWQAIYRHAFYRGGPVLTSALSGIDQALWDIKGKLFGVPVYELLGGPTRQRIRVYAHAATPDL